MRDVYRKASEVLVWLGPESNTSARAMDFMKMLCSEANSFTVDASVAEQDQTMERIRVLFLNPRLRPDWSALEEFLQRPWWGRIWVTQEIAVATKATFMCGDLRMPLGHVDQFIFFIASLRNLFARRSSRKITPTNRVFASIQGLATPLGLTMAARMRVQRSFAEGEPLELTELLSNSKIAACTNPRDRLFAFYGMTFASGYGDEFLKPDYDLPTSEVYINVAVHIVKSRQNLNLLLHVSHSLYMLDCERKSVAGISGLPSWVPEWSSMTLGLFESSTLARPTTIYQASLGQMPPNSLFFLEKDTVLQVKGVRVDAIATIWKIAGKDTFRSVCRQWRSMILQPDDDVYRGMQTVREAFWRTVLCNQSLGLTRQTSTGEWLQERLRDRVDDLAFPPLTAGQEDRFMDFLEDKEPSFGTKRRFFRTATGYIGICPIVARPGDIVAVILGGFVPFVLRPSQGHRYTFLGGW